MRKQQASAWPIESEPSWTDEALPLELRQRLLDRAFEQIKERRGLAVGHRGIQDPPDHPGESGSESSGHKH